LLELSRRMAGLYTLRCCDASIAIDNIIAIAVVGIA
jgi:predicted tellurium resistance membrane protein TerC